MSQQPITERIDAFELELTYVEALVDMLYATPLDHEYRNKTLEDLHTHRLNMRKAYNDIRSEIIEAVIHGKSE